MQRFRKWSVRKLRRRPRSHDKFDGSSRNKTSTLTSLKELQHSTSSDDSKYRPFESSSLVERGKKIDRTSISSEDSAILDLKNDSTLYGKILTNSQNVVNDNKTETKRVDSDIDADLGIRSDVDIVNEEPSKSDNSGIEGNVLLPSNSETNLSSRSDISLNTSEISENKDTGTEKQSEEKQSESDVLMFGCDLPKPLIEGSLELSSDQDSTAGEDEEFADEEDIENLHPDMLLYKAAAAHNLPVMCVALAAGADKMWANANDRGRNAIHQAIISVSCNRNCKYSRYQ